MNEMTQTWTPEETARAMLEVFPNLGRLMHVRMRETGEEEATFMQMGVLARIQEGRMTTSDLAKMRKVSLQSASVLVQALVDRGWLTRTPDPNDRRQQLLEVTPEGAERARAVRDQMIGLIAAVVHDLTPEELQAASVFLPALHRVITTQLHPDDVTEPLP